MVGVRAKDHDEKRQIILDKATELFGQQGFHKASIAQISKACNSSKAWIFHYFPNKEAILYTILNDFLEMFTEHIQNALSGVDEPKEKLRALLKVCLSVYIENRFNYPILFNDIDCLPKAEQQSLRKIERESVNILKGIIVELNPSLAGDKRLKALTLMLFGSINWSYTWYKPSGAVSLDELVDITEQLFLNGLKSF